MCDSLFFMIETILNTNFFIFLTNKIAVLSTCKASEHFFKRFNSYLFFINIIWRICKKWIVHGGSVNQPLLPADPAPDSRDLLDVSLWFKVQGHTQSRGNVSYSLAAGRAAG